METFIQTLLTPLLNLSGESGSFTNVIWSPFLPAIWLWIGAGIALALFLYGIYHRIKGSLFRALIAGFLLLSLCNPVLVEEEREYQKDIALILLDDSASQKINDRENESAAALKELQEELAPYQDSLEVRVFRLSDLNPQDSLSGESNLIGALDKAKASIPANRHAGSFLISDGQAHDIPQKLAEEGEEETTNTRPLHLLLSGQKNEVDRRIEIIHAPAYGLVNEEVQVKFRVVEDGISPSNQLIPVTIRADGERPKRLSVEAGQGTIVGFTLNRRGPLNIAFETAPLEKEISTSNNQLALSVNGIRDRLKVLLVSGVPHPGERTWRNLLKSDPSVELVHFTILRPPEKQDDTPVNELSLIAFPTRELFQTKLHEFDLIVFDRYRRRGVLPSIYLQNIVKYVENGGALLEISGPSYASPYSLYRTSLGSILPGEPNGGITQAPYKPQVTETGLRHPVTARLPKGPLVAMTDDIRWGRWLRQISVTAQEGDVLMNGAQEQPLLILNRVEDGRVAQLFSDHIWLWARGYEGGGPYAELIRRLSHWLMKEPELEENDLKASLEGNKLIVEMRSLASEAAEVTVTGPTGDSFSMQLTDRGNGRYRGERNLDLIGLYEVKNAETSVLAVQKNGLGQEWQSLISSSEKLAPLVEKSQGSIRYIHERLLPVSLEEAGGRFSLSNQFTLIKNGAYSVTGITYQALIEGWISMLLALGLILGCWRREAK